MAKVTIKLEQSEIEEAVKEYMADRVQAGYRFKLGELDVNFSESDEGQVSCDVTSTVSEEPKET